MIKQIREYTDASFEVSNVIISRREIENLKDILLRKDQRMAYFLPSVNLKKNLLNNELSNLEKSDIIDENDELILDLNKKNDFIKTLSNFDLNNDVDRKLMKNSIKSLII